MTEIPLSGAAELMTKPSESNAHTLRSAARFWLAAQALFLLGTAAYALLFSRSHSHWAWWLLYAGGPRFTSVGTGVCSVFISLLCAAGWVRASWKLSSIGGDSHSLLVNVVRWGGLILLFGAELERQGERIFGFAGPRRFMEIVVTAEVVLALAIALHLRCIGRQLGDRVLKPMLDVVVYAVGFDLILWGIYWFGASPRSRGLALAFVLVPILRASTFALVMARLLAAPSLRQGSSSPLA
jgi:hypothetical protein